MRAVLTLLHLQFADSIYEDFARYKNILKAQYEEKIQEHAFRLWQEINDRLQYVEEFYQQVLCSFLDFSFLSFILLA